MPELRDLDDLSNEELAEQARELKRQGNEHYKERKFEEALAAYTEAVEICPEEYKKDRAIYYGNIAACQFEQGDYKDAVESSTKALELDESYAKVRRRRVLANEQVGTWNALEKAMEDLKKLKEDAKDDPAQIRDIETHMRRIEPKMSAKQKEEMDEMLGKLKNLGNGLLGKFGMSLDDFKMEKNADGGYSLNMGK